MFCRPLVLFLLMFAVKAAGSPFYQETVFSYTGDVGFGNSVFVVGDNDALGNNDLALAPKLRFTSGNVWTGTIALPLSGTYRYHFVKRTTSASTYTSSSNAV